MAPTYAQDDSSAANASPLARLEAAYAQEVREKVDAGYNAGMQKLNDAYRGALDAALKRVSSAGLLDDAVALKDELTRFTSDTSVPEKDAPGTQPEIARLRLAWRAESDRLQKQRNAATKPIVADYSERLRLLEVELTRALKLEDAKAVREKRTILAKSVVEPTGPASPAGGSTAGAATPRPGLPIVPTVRPAERMDIYDSGSNGCIIYLNNKEILPKVMRDTFSKVRVGLREGDVITVKNQDRFDINSFWLSCISSNGEFLFDSSEGWNCYLPEDFEKWWNTKKIKEQKPVQIAPDSQEYVNLVKKSAASTPLYRGAQPIRSVLKDGSRKPYENFFVYVVTKKDLLPKKLD